MMCEREERGGEQPDRESVILAEVWRGHQKEWEARGVGFHR